MTRPTLYPEDPAPRGLDGQEFAALWMRAGSSVSVLWSRHNTVLHQLALTSGKTNIKENISVSYGKMNSLML